MWIQGECNYSQLTMKMPIQVPQCKPLYRIKHELSYQT